MKNFSPPYSKENSIQKYELDIISIEKDEKSSQKDATQEKKQFSGVDFLEPEKEIRYLVDLTRKSAILGACINALEVGIYGTGFELVNRYPELEKEKKSEIEAEKNRITEFLESVDSSGQHSYNEFLRKLGRDIESTGNGYIEILYYNGKPYAFNIIDPATMRLTEYDNQITFWDRHFYDYDSKKYFTKSIPTKFRRYIHLNPDDGSYSFFKMMGDPRILDSKTGKYYSKEDYEKLPKKEKEKIKIANEIFHFSLYSTSSDYGVPRWQSALNSVVGSILHEENNLNFLKNGLKTDKIIYSDSPITKTSIERLKAKFKENSSIDRKSAFILVNPSIEEKALVGDDSKPIFKVIELDKQSDAEFINYDKSNEDRVITSCRLSKILVGKSEGYNKATAQASMETVENNTFLNAREKIDSFINNRIFPLLGIRYHIYRSKSSTKQSRNYSNA